MAAPASQDIVITRGDTLTVIVVMTTNGTTPIDITGRTYTAMVREDYDSSSASASMTCVVTSGVNGQVTLSIDAATMANLQPYNYVWDLQENASGVVSTVLSGRFLVLPDVTRS